MRIPFYHKSGETHWGLKLWLFSSSLVAATCYVAVFPFASLTTAQVEQRSFREHLFRETRWTYFISLSTFRAVSEFTGLAQNSWKSDKCRN